AGRPEDPFRPLVGLVPGRGVAPRARRRGGGAAGLHAPRDGAGPRRPPPVREERAGRHGRAGARAPRAGRRRAPRRDGLPHRRRGDGARGRGVRGPPPHARGRAGGKGARRRGRAGAAPRRGRRDDEALQGSRRQPLHPRLRAAPPRRPAPPGPRPAAPRRRRPPRRAEAADGPGL
ncbi:MAG: hypothetical protein AVDCRST_MAG68-2628, partial [uncultured Gemmatimonadetes bacterium]